jgi:hypothetical protein
MVQYAELRQSRDIEASTVAGSLTSIWFSEPISDGCSR